MKVDDLEQARAGQIPSTLNPIILSAWMTKVRSVLYILAGLYLIPRTAPGLTSEVKLEVFD